MRRKKETDTFLKPNPSKDAPIVSTQEERVCINPSISESNNQQDHATDAARFTEEHYV
jgi:hypothetical protein